MNVPLVQNALNCKGKITNEMLEFIYSDTNPLEEKLAIINAIGWNKNGMMNSKMFFMYVMNKKKYQSDYGGDYMAFKWDATRDELICFAYMKALDNYFDVVDAYIIAGEAAIKYPDSFAVSMICNLIKALGLTAYEEYCYSSKMFLSLKDNSKLKLDMKKEAMTYVFEYMEEIGKDCKTN